MPLIFRAVPEFPQLESLHKDKASSPQEGGREGVLLPASPPPPSEPMHWSAGQQHGHLRATDSGQAWVPCGNAPDRCAGRTLSVFIHGLMKHKIAWGGNIQVAEEGLSSELRSRNSDPKTHKGQSKNRKTSTTSTCSEGPMSLSFHTRCCRPRVPMPGS